MVQAGGQASGQAGSCQTCGTHISVTAWRIFSIRSSVVLSKPVGVHCHSHLPICPIWACPWAKNLSNQAALGPDFAETISLKPLDGFIPFEVLWNCLDLSLCNIMVIWPWRWILKVKFWKCCISGMEGPIDMERKGCESIGCCTHFVTFNVPLTHDLDLGLSRSNLKKSYLRDEMADWHGIKGMWVNRILDPCCDFKCPRHPWPWPWIFKVKFWKCCISGMGGATDIERKECESIRCYTHFVTFNFDLSLDFDLGFSRSNFEIVVSQEWDGWLAWNQRDVSR